MTPWLLLNQMPFQLENSNEQEGQGHPSVQMQKKVSLWKYSQNQSSSSSEEEGEGRYLDHKGWEYLTKQNPLCGVFDQREEGIMEPVSRNP